MARGAGAAVSPWAAAVAAVALLVVLDSAGSTGLPCDRKCNGRGVCDFIGSKHAKKRACKCFPGWGGSDCSYRVCPKGKQWGGYSFKTDGAHDVMTECSGVGTCDSQTGRCTCPALFEGEACESMACPGTPSCSGSGRCLSLRQAAALVDGQTLKRSFRYSLWDADRVFGCVCDEGKTGYDCSATQCPKGADPLEVALAGKVPEVQTISCTCPGTCSGHVVASLFGAATDPIAHDAVALASLEDPSQVSGGSGQGQSLQTLLETLSPKMLIKNITMSAGKLCSATGATTTVTFTHGMGNVPQILVDFQTTLRSNGQTAAAGAAVSVTVATTTEATIVSEECSFRGACAAGVCRCSTPFTQSDGSGGAGTVGDCGHLPTGANLTACGTAAATKVCSGHGTCSGAPKYRCSCVSGFSGGDCSLRACPLGRAWFDEAFGEDMAHRLSECSSMGNCDRQSGTCACRPGFTGAACDRLQCPKDELGQECAGRGRCLSLRKLAPLGRVMGGHPQNGRNEIQKIVCSLSSGAFQLTYKFAITRDIAFSATALTLRNALEELYPLQFVEVKLVPDNGAVCSAAGQTTLVEFTDDPGDLPLMTSNSASAVVSEHQKGSKISYGLDVTNAATWDANQIHACHCDGYPDYNQSLAGGDRGRYSGPACQYRTCPTGSDPMGAVPIRYRITCTGSSGTLRLSFSGSTSATLGAATTASDLATALAAMDTVEGTSAIDMPSGTLCAAPAASTTQVWLTTRVGEHAVADLAAADVALTAGSGTAAASVTRVSSVLGNENQTLACTANGGSFTLEYQGFRTAPIPASADEAAFQAALQDLKPIGRVTISMSGVTPRTVCSAAGVSTLVTFSTQLGDLPAMLPDAASLTLSTGTPALTVTETDKGTTKPEECAGRGFCDTARGMCQCLASYVSSDGQGHYGQRGDCGAVDPLFANTHPTEWAVANLR